MKITSTLAFLGLAAGVAAQQFDGQKVPIDVCGKYALELYHIQDVTGSYSQFLPTIKEKLPEILGLLKQKFDKVRFGVGSFADVPSPTARFDKCFQGLTPLTSDVQVVKNSMWSLIASGGGDTPENGVGAMLGAAQDYYGEIGWTKGDYDAEGYPVLKIITLTTDAASHLAGDGAHPISKWGPVNDGLGRYKSCKDEDYPSLAQLRSALKKRSINPVVLIPKRMRANTYPTWAQYSKEANLNFTMGLLENNYTGLVESILSMVRQVSCEKPTPPPAPSTTTTTTVPTTTTTVKTTTTTSDKITGVTDAVTGTGTGTDAITGTGTGTDPVTGTGTGTGTDPATVTGTGTGTDSVTGTGTGTDSVTGTGTDDGSVTKTTTECPCKQQTTRPATTTVEETKDGTTSSHLEGEDTSKDGDETTGDETTIVGVVPPPDSKKKTAIILGASGAGALIAAAAGFAAYNLSGMTPESIEGHFDADEAVDNITDKEQQTAIHESEFV